MVRVLARVLLLLLAVASEARATFSLVTLDPEEQRMGVALTSCAGTSTDIFGFVPTDAWVFVPEHGGAIHQADSPLYPQLRARTQSLLSEGKTPSEIFSALAADFSFEDIMKNVQVGVVDLNGRWAAHTGAKTYAWQCDGMLQSCAQPGWGGRVGDYVVSIQGNMLTGPGVLDGMSRGLDGACDQVDALMRSLEGGTTTPDGQLQGDVRCTISGAPSDVAFLRVVDRAGTVLVDLQALHPCSCPWCIFPPCKQTECRCPEANAVVLLRQKYDEWRKDHPCGTLGEATGCNAAPTRRSPLFYVLPWPIFFALLWLARARGSAFRRRR